MLIIDFDPQCNLSVAFLGENVFKDSLPNENKPYGKGIRSYLQKFLQGTGQEEYFLHESKESKNVYLIAGDFWLNIYSEQLNVGNDLLSGSGLSRFVVLRKMVDEIEEKEKMKFDFVFIDVPPSFGSLVRAAFYSSNYIIVPCTSDNFSSYCVSLIGQMLPKFISEWDQGFKRFKENNPYFSEFDNYGKPKFLGWIFNGFDTAKKRNSESLEKVKHLADENHFKNIEKSIKNDLVGKLNQRRSEFSYDLVTNEDNFCLGEIEDMNVLVQESIWQNTPIPSLLTKKPTHGSYTWATNQKEQIHLLTKKFKEITDNINLNLIKK